MSRSPDATWPLEPVSAADAGAIASLLHACMVDAWTELMVDESLAAGAVGLVLAREPQEPGSPRELVACGLLRIVGAEAEILQLAVAADARRRGLGDAMLRRLLGKCAHDAVERVFLEVRAGNVAARELYRRAGFVEIGLRPRYYRDGEAAIVMRLGLSFPLPPC